MPITIVLFAKLFLRWFCLNMLFGRLSLVFWSEVAGIVQRECADIAFIQIKANKWLAVAFKRTVSCNYKSAKWDLALTTVKFNYLKRLQFQMNQFLSPVNYKLHQQLNILPVPGARTAFFPAWSTLSAEQIFLQAELTSAQNLFIARVLNYHRPVLTAFTATACCQLKGRHFLTMELSGANQHCLLIYGQSIMLPLLNPIIRRYSEWKLFRVV